MAKADAGRKRVQFSFLGPGLVTLPRDYHKELFEKGKLFTPNVLNADYYRSGSIRRPTGWTQRGEDVISSSPIYEQAIHDTTATETLDDSLTIYQFGNQWTNSGTRPVAKGRVWLGYGGRYPSKLWLQIYTNIVDGIDKPGTLIQESLPFLTGSGFSAQYIDFNFPDAVPLTNATKYWFIVKIETTKSFGTSGDSTGLVRGLQDGSDGPYAVRSDEGAWNIVSTFLLTATLNPGDPPGVGLWDWRFADPAGIFQYYGAACDGNLFAGDPDTVDAGGSWGNAIWEDGNDSRIALWDSEQLGALVAITDHGHSYPRLWDGIFGSDRSPAELDADSTMRLGYKSPLTAAVSGGASNWSSVGLVQVLIVTELLSGGYRATYATATLVNINDDVDLTNLAISEDPAEFYFDIAALATTVFCTQPGRGVFYKVPAAKLSTSANPISNATTSVSIAGMTDATLAAENDLETATGFPTGYFTRQIDTPKGRYLAAIENCLAMVSQEFPYSVFISGQQMPNVWSEYGGTYGVRLNVNPGDGEPITGIYARQRALYVFKAHQVYRFDFTGDNSDPWRLTDIDGSLGTLSHWSVQEIPGGLLFIDDSGPSICYGSFTALAPASEGISNIFDGRDVGDGLAITWKPVNLEAMRFCSSVLDARQQRVRWLLAQGEEVSATKTIQLVYDFAQKAFTVYQQIPLSVIATIGNANGLQRIWGFGYAADVYSDSEEHDQTAGQMMIETPWLDLGMPGVFKDADWLWIWGQRSTQTENTAQTLGTVLIWTDGPDDVSLTSAVPLILAFDTSLRAYQQGGVAIKLPPKAFRRIKLAFYSPFQSTEANAIEGFALEFTPEGQRR